MVLSRVFNGLPSVHFKEFGEEPKIFILQAYKAISMKMNKQKTGYDHISGQKVSRIEALSDGVFAVAITLLVLDIKAPVSDAIKTEADLCAFSQHLPRACSPIL